MVLELHAAESGSEIPGNFEMWCWRRVEKIIWTDRVRNEEALQSYGGKVIPHAIERRMIGLVTSCIGLP